VSKANCKVCKTPFEKNHHRKVTCSYDCRREHKLRADRARLRQTYQEKMKPPEPPQASYQLACTKCKYATKSEHADSGWECSKSLFLKCKPYSTRALAQAATTGVGYGP
jgi:hypothetical protein